MDIFEYQGHLEYQWIVLRSVPVKQVVESGPVFCSCSLNSRLDYQPLFGKGARASPRRHSFRGGT